MEPRLNLMIAFYTNPLDGTHVGSLFLSPRPLVTSLKNDKLKPESGFKVYIVGFAVSHRRGEVGLRNLC